MTAEPALSVVIPTLGRPDVLSGTLDDLAGQNLERWECIVVAQDSASAESASSHRLAEEGVLSVEKLDATNASAARNLGLVSARADVVLFLDDDVRVDDSNFFSAHLENYTEPDVPGVVGQVLPPSGEERNSRHPRSRRARVGWLYFPFNYSWPGRLDSALTGNLSVRRGWALEVGGMDEQYEKGAHREDSDFCLRLTSRYGPLVFDPSASLIHLGEEDGGCRSWGMNRGVHPVHHVTGEWYFILKNLAAGRIRLRDLPDHLFCLVRRQFVNSENLRRPWNLIRAVGRSLRGIVRALSKLRDGPRCLEGAGQVPRGAGREVSPAESRGATREGL